MNINLHIESIVVDDPNLNSFNARQLSNSIRAQLSGLLQTTNTSPPIRPASFAVLPSVPSKPGGGGTADLSRSVANTVHRALSQPDAPVSRGAR